MFYTLKLWTRALRDILMRACVLVQVCGLYIFLFLRKKSHTKQLDSGPLSAHKNSPADAQKIITLSNVPIFPCPNENDPKNI